ncbi:trypsin-like peptidase domain-containing protein [uncultured Roseibium sp.]|uniref:trypsin-like peptidase domain-containing protein n=1 Tax=uncultured Roseibium sp. TaxID=1936171 RepID=UPI002604EBE2|nr:trypsin-like peptidase domain-containing protein [uncultured Roseibium sp.]
MPRCLSHAVYILVLCFAGLIAGQVKASPDKALEHVVSVLPVWPGHDQGGQGARPGQAPEGSGVVLREGVIATAWHVVEPARRIDVRLHDGRIIPARLMAHDASTDIALLKVEEKLQPIATAPPPNLVQPVCAIGNAFGLGLSFTCGVVSAKGISNAGFNEIEDFVQTDATANPGSSGGALVDTDGRLVGMMSAIFASGSDTNIGMNFAISTELLLRVAEALIDTGQVGFQDAGWQLARTDRTAAALVAAPVVRIVRSDGAAKLAGIEVGDLILEIGNRRVRTPHDAKTAVALIPKVQRKVQVRYRRGDDDHVATLSFETPDPPKVSNVDTEPSHDVDCPHPSDVCKLRQAVFPISSFDPVGSATRIAEDLLVTNRHVVGDQTEAIVHTPNGPLNAQLVPSAYEGDLVLLEVENLPDTGVIPNLDVQAETTSQYLVVGADIARKEVRVFEPGDLIARPEENAKLGRLHVRAHMQPGVSGGALVTATGALAGIAVGGGDGRFEAIPLADVHKLLALRDDRDAIRLTESLGADFVACEEAMENAVAQTVQDVVLTAVADTCSNSTNHGQMLKAGRILAQSGAFEQAIRLHGEAAEQVPNSINSRMSLLVSLQLAGRFEDMTEHARRLMELAPDDPQALRFSIQSGVWGNEPELAEEGYQALLKADPRQAQAARRFIDNAPPAPQRR